eukprot:TRINITY_DN18736_c0_g1_i3.p1 TRINITY_DN18736_c0_g1~~TRINITY_DN18736_c0_g1_i3.p1  ORF type:complete len:149 (+),score=17.26 TRINITY_DN18736_c0_g1_i3:197-643(+)
MCMNGHPLQPLASSYTISVTTPSWCSSGSASKFVKELFAKPSSRCPCALQDLSLASNPKMTSGDVVALLRGILRQAQEVGPKLQNLDLSQTGAGPQVLPLITRTMSQLSSLRVDLSKCQSLQFSEETSTQANWSSELTEFVRSKRLLL